MPSCVKMKLCSGYYLRLKEYIPSWEKWNVCPAKSLFVSELISFSFKREWAHRKTVESKSCCVVIFIYRSIHSLRSPCSGRWSWGTTITSPLPVAPVAIIIYNPFSWSPSASPSSSRDVFVSSRNECSYAFHSKPYLKVSSAQEWGCERLCL